jgi:hypothetical protein
LELQVGLFVKRLESPRIGGSVPNVVEKGIGMSYPIEKQNKQRGKGIGARTNQIGILRGSTGCLKGLTEMVPGVVCG